MRIEISRGNGLLACYYMNPGISSHRFRLSFSGKDKRALHLLHVCCCFRQLISKLMYSQTRVKCSRPISSLPGLQGQKPKTHYYFTFWNSTIPVFMNFLWDQPVLSYSSHGSQKSGANQKRLEIGREHFRRVWLYILLHVVLNCYGDEEFTDMYREQILKGYSLGITCWLSRKTYKFSTKQTSGAKKLKKKYIPMVHLIQPLQKVSFSSPCTVYMHVFRSLCCQAVSTKIKLAL